MDFLTTVSIQADLQTGRFNMARPWFNKAKELKDEFALNKDEHDAHNRNLYSMIRKRRACINQLKLTIRDFDQSLFNRIRRLQLDASTSSFYKAASSGVQASARTLHGWQVIAQDRINGDILAVEAGLEAMINPGAADLQVCLDELAVIMGQAELVDRTFQQSQQKLEQLRTETVNLWRVLYHSIRALTPELDDPAQRRLLRSFGYRYRIIKDKPVEAGSETNENQEGNPNNPQPNENTPENNSQEKEAQEQANKKEVNKEEN